MEPRIQYAKTEDGASIAYSTMGDGPPLVRPPGWISHLEREWKDPSSRAFYEPLARHNTCITYDKHGTGLSDRDRNEFTLAAELNDLETVLDHLELERVAMLGISQAGPVCAAYAAKYPDRVSHLILYGTYARGPEIATEEIQKSMISLIRAHWGMGSKALADVFIPGADPEEAERFAKFQRAAASSEMAARLLDLCYQIDVSDQLGSITAPTIVMHRDRDRAISSVLGRRLAAMIPGARFIPLEGRMHPIQLEDSEPILQAIGEFLGHSVTGEPSGRLGAARGGLVTVLFTDMESSVALTQRLGDAQAQELVREHNGIVRHALKASGGSEIKQTGDGIMASFASASGALECAVAIQREVSLRQAQGGHAGPVEASLRVKVGLNAGEPVAEDEDLFGTAVQLAARICDRAGGGEILASDVVRQLAAGKGFRFSDRGDAEMRGFQEPVRLYEVRWREE